MHSTVWKHFDQENTRLLARTIGVTRRLLGGQVLALLVASVLAYLLLAGGCGRRPTHDARTLTVDEFRRAIRGRSYPKAAFFAQYGQPWQIVDMGKDKLLLYQCLDGTAGVVIPADSFLSKHRIIPLGVDRPD